MKEIFILLTLAILIFGCSKKEDKIDCHNGFDLYAATADEIQNLSNAALDYAKEPNSPNCEQYKTALGIYVDALENYETCALEFGFSDDWNEAIQQSRESVQKLQCQ